MKLKYVFLIAVTTIIAIFTVKKPLSRYLMQKDELSPSCASFFILKDVLDTTITGNKNLYQTYESFLRSSRMAERKVRIQKQKTILWETYAKTYQEAQQQISTAKRKREIIYVKRVASAFIMNNPAFYKRRISDNVITEKGQASDEEMLTMFYLSDGNIIKSSPKQNSKWLGLKVGEKVLKISGFKLSFDKKNGYGVIAYTEYQPLYN